MERQLISVLMLIELYRLHIDSIDHTVLANTHCDWYHCAFVLANSNDEKRTDFFGLMD